MTKFEIGRAEPTLIQVIFTFSCSECGESVKQEWAGQLIGLPEWPAEGWQLIGERGFSRWVCPNHKPQESA